MFTAVLSPSVCLQILRATLSPHIKRDTLHVKNQPRFRQWITLSFSPVVTFLLHAMLLVALKYLVVTQHMPSCNSKHRISPPSGSQK